jgi:hypothetical protein
VLEHLTGRGAPAAEARVPFEHPAGSVRHHPAERIGSEDNTDVT